MADDRQKYPSYVLILIGSCILVFIFAIPALSTSKGGVRGASEMTSVRLSGSYKLRIITDLDQQSKVAGAKKPTWAANIRDVILTPDPVTKQWDAQFGEPRPLQTHYNEAGRGAEFSELLQYHGKLYTADDRTGIIFEITNKDTVIARFVSTEGDGSAMKGQKFEWATVKDDVMYFGSIGKEYTLEDGSIGSLGGNWVTTIDANGILTRHDWTENYKAIRKATGTEFPAYTLHEAITWSPFLRRWAILPRRICTEPYNEILDETKGSNTLILADEQFKKLEVRKVGEIISGYRGFSTFKFLPGSRDKIIVAIKSEEHNDTGKQTSYLTVFTLAGEVLMPEIEIPGEAKYEGLEFY